MFHVKQSEEMKAHKLYVEVKQLLKEIALESVRESDKLLKRLDFSDK